MRKSADSAMISRTMPKVTTDSQRDVRMNVVLAYECSLLAGANGFHTEYDRDILKRKVAYRNSVTHHAHRRMMRTAGKQTSNAGHGMLRYQGQDECTTPAHKASN